MPADRAEMNRKMVCRIEAGGYLVSPTIPRVPATALVSPRHCIGSRKAPCGKEIEAAASSSPAKPISCAIPRIRATRRYSVRQIPNDEFVLKYQKPL